jgi:hypothetical protein
MGTSSSYGGPVGSNPLLPDWAQPDVGDVDGPVTEDGSPDDQGADEKADGSPAPNQVQMPAVDFRGAKSSMTQWVKSGGGAGRDSVGRVGRNYVRARGGSRGSATVARSGRASTAGVGSFFSTVARDGIAQAARELGIRDLAGRPAIEVFAEIANRIAPEGATLEEAAARRAVDTALQDLFNDFDLGERDISALDQMTADDVRDAIQTSVSEYIYQRWLQELGDRLEDNAVTANEAVALEGQVKGYVYETIKLDLQDVDVLAIDWNGSAGQKITEQVYQEAYEFFL